MDTTFYDSVANRFTYLNATYEAKKKQVENVQAELDTLREEKDILTKAEKVLKALVDQLAKKDLDRMDRLVTFGLNTVFPDRDIRFKTEIVERGRKMSVDLQTLYNGNLVDPQSKSSIHVIESFLLRILCILKMKKAPLLLMDESFAAVDQGYIDNVSRLLAQLAAKLKMDILLVTHNPGFSEVEHMSYRLNKKDGSVVVERTR